MRSVILVRIGDNVLDDKDYPVRRLIVSENGVEAAKDIHSGVYSTDGMPAPGWSIDRLVEWLSWDPTGRHPEVWFDIKNEEDSDWSNIHSREGLDKFLARGVYNDETMVVEP